MTKAGSRENEHLFVHAMLCVSVQSALPCNNAGMLFLSKWQAFKPVQQYNLAHSSPAAQWLLALRGLLSVHRPSKQTVTRKKVMQHKAGPVQLSHTLHPVLTSPNLPARVCACQQHLAIRQTCLLCCC